MKTRVLLLGLALAVLSGCGYTYHFKNAGAQPGEEHNQWASYFLFGIVGDHEVDVREFCPNGVYEITTGTNFLTWLVSGITLGIYTPRKVNIWCNAGPTPVAFEIELDEDKVPARVTRRVGSVTSSGAVKRVGGSRYGVLFQEGEGR